MKNRARRKYELTVDKNIPLPPPPSPTIKEIVRTMRIGDSVWTDSYNRACSIGIIMKQVKLEYRLYAVDEKDPRGKGFRVWRATKDTPKVPHGKRGHP